jgi:hypothetical protein
MRIIARLAAAATLLALLTGCNSSRPADASITQEIQSKLFASAEAKSASIDVSTNAGVVTLSGTVPNDAARYAAFKIATEATGVTKVNDQLTVSEAKAEPAPAPAEAAPAPVKPAPKPARKSEPAQARPPKAESAALAQPKAAEPAPAPAPTPVAAAQPPEPPPFVRPTPPPAPPAPVMRTVEIPAGTIVRVQMIDSVDSSINKPGEMFRASLAAPIVSGTEVAVPAGTDLDVRLVDSASAGRMAGRSDLVLQLARLDYQGRYQQTGASEGKRTATKIGGGAAIGAIIGGLIGGGKGAAIGAGTGAGAGTVASAAGKGQQVRIEAEAKLEFTLQQPVSITYNPDKIRTGR